MPQKNNRQEKNHPNLKKNKQKKLKQMVPNRKPKP